MDGIRAGRAFRALRVHLDLRQRDVAERAGVSQQHVSDLERGQMGAMSLDDVSALFAAIGAVVSLTVHWRGGYLDRLLDEGHAAVVGEVAERLRAIGWDVIPEATYSEYGERGSVDILAWHAATHTLLVIEVKTEITSAEELLRRHDAKVRLGPKLCRSRFGLTPVAIGRLLVVADTSTNRRRVARLDPILGGVYHLRGGALRAWLRRPTGTMGGLLFAGTAGRGGGRSPIAGSRVRRTQRTADGGERRGTGG